MGLCPLGIWASLLGWPFVRGPVGGCMKKKMEDRPLEFLLHDLKNPAVYVKKTAIMQLEKKKSVQALPMLLELAQDGEASIRSCVAWALGQLGGSGVQS